MNATTGPSQVMFGAGQMITFSYTSYMETTFTLLLIAFALVGVAMALVYFDPCNVYRKDAKYLKRVLATFGILIAAHAFAMLAILKATGGQVDSAWVLAFFTLYSIFNISLNANLKKFIHGDEKDASVFRFDWGDYDGFPLLSMVLQGAAILGFLGFTFASYWIYADYDNFDKDSFTLAVVAFACTFPIMYPKAHSESRPILGGVTFGLMVLRLVAIIVFKSEYTVETFPVYFFGTELAYLALTFVFVMVSAIASKSQIENKSKGAAGPESVHLMVSRP